MRITIEIEDGAVRSTHDQGAMQREAANAGGPPADLVQLIGMRPGLSAQASGGREADAVNVGGPPDDLLRALAAPAAGRAPATNAGAPPTALLAAMDRPQET